MSWQGWDIGGAHLKGAAIGDDGSILDVVQIPCPLWKGLNELTACLDMAQARLGPATHHAVTMTGELVDLFPDRPQGVASLVGLCAQRWGDQTKFWAGTKGFLNADQAKTQWRYVASANWLATAALCTLHISDFLLMDMGSTTTDLLAISGGKLDPLAIEDGDRLITGELVYTGVARTPLMALGPKIPFGDIAQAIAAEFFATTADVYTLLGDLNADASQYPTADGRSASDEDCARRLARMVGRDLDDVTLSEWRELAEAFMDRQLSLIEEAAEGVLLRTPLARTAPVVGAGLGAFNAKRMAARLNRPYRAITDFLTLAPAAQQWGQAAVTSAAVAILAATRRKR